MFERMLKQFSYNQSRKRHRKVGGGPTQISTKYVNYTKNNKPQKTPRGVNLNYASKPVPRKAPTKSYYHSHHNDGQQLVLVMIIICLCLVMFSSCTGGGEEDGGELEVEVDVSSAHENVIVVGTNLNADIETPLEIYIDKQELQTLINTQLQETVIELNELNYLIQEEIANEEFSENFEATLLNMDYSGISSIISLAINNHKAIDLALATWHVETLNGTSSKEIQTIIKSGAENAIYDEYRDIYRQFIFDIEYFFVGANRDYELVKTAKNDNAIIALDPKKTVATTEVVNMADGTIIKAGWEEDTGYTIYVQTSGGAVICYGYLDSIPSHIQVGKYILAGQWLGMMSNKVGIVEGQTGNIDVGVYVEGFVSYNDKWIPMKLEEFVKRVENNKSDLRWVSK